MGPLHLTLGISSLAALAAAGVIREPEGKGAMAPAVADTLQEQIARGRLLVISHACGDCHGGGSNPDSPAWLAGVQDSLQIFEIGPFKTRPRNLTPDNTTGIGRFIASYF